MGKMTNSFGLGMDQDSSKKKYDNQHYYEANNVRIITQDGLSSGALEDIEGNLYRLLINFSSPMYIVGHCILRDDIIIFCTKNSTNVPNLTYDDYIIKIPIATLENLAGTDAYTALSTYVHNSGDVIYTEKLGFCKANPIQAIGRYETDSIQKVYWVDDNNKFRYLNIVYDANTNDLETLPIARLEVLGDILRYFL